MFGQMGVEARLKKHIAKKPSFGCVITGAVLYEQSILILVSPEPRSQPRPRVTTLQSNLRWMGRM